MPHQQRWTDGQVTFKVQVPPRTMKLRCLDPAEYLDG